MSKRKFLRLFGAQSRTHASWVLEDVLTSSQPAASLTYPARE